MKKNMMIYPFGCETTPIVRNLDMIKEISVLPVASKSWSFCKNDIANFDGGSSKIEEISYDFEKSFEKCDSIYIPFERNILTIDNYIALIDKISKSQKRIIISRDLKNKLGTNISKFDEMGVCDFYDEKLEIEKEQILPINIPVIMILGDGINCNKFDIQLSLRKYFLSKGFSVCQFGTKEYSSFFGFKSLPKFLFDSVCLKDKIIALNHLIYKEVSDKKHDLLIIGVPGGALPISEEHPTDFGEFAYIISNAVKPDIAIRSVYYNKYPKLFFNNDILMSKYKLSSEVEYYNIANKQLVFPYDRYSELDYLTIKNEEILNYISIQSKETEGYMLFNSLEESNFTCVYDNILKQLTENQVTI